MDPKAMFKISYGLYILTTKANGKDNGCIINTAIQAASDPNTLSICVNKANYTHDLIKESGTFAVSAISQEGTFDLFQRFGFQTGRTVDKFEGFTALDRTPGGLYYVTQGTNAFFEADVFQQVDLGSHTMFLAKPTAMEILADVPSTTYDYYQSNIKPKPAAPAEPAGKVIWRCTICGYEYEGEELPADFICPICKHPASDFEKVIV